MAKEVHGRRRFLTGIVQTVAGATLTGWAGPGQTATAAGGFTLIDTHTHFYDPTRAQGVPWPPRDDKLLYRTVLPKDYRALPVPKPVTGTVVVEASPWLEDNQWVLDLAAHEPFLVGFVGNLAVGTKQFAGHLKRFAANNRFRGIRLSDRKLQGRLAHSGSDSTHMQKVARQAAVFTASTLGLVCIASGAIALVNRSTGSDLQGMLGLQFQVTPVMIVGVIVAGGMMILALNWWLTIKSVERAYGYFVAHANSASA